MNGVEILRLIWVLVCSVGAVRSWRNWRLVQRADKQRRAAQLDGVLEVRTRFTRRDVLLLGNALALSATAAAAAIAGQAILALVAICLEHALLVWLAFNFATGWYAVNHQLLEFHLRKKTLGDRSPLDPHGPVDLKPMGG